MLLSQLALGWHLLRLVIVVLRMVIHEGSFALLRLMGGKGVFSFLSFSRVADVIIDAYLVQALGVRLYVVSRSC